MRVPCDDKKSPNGFTVPYGHSNHCRTRKDKGMVVYGRGNPATSAKEKKKGQREKYRREWRKAA